MSLPVALTSTTCYSGSHGSACWRGRVVDNADAFREYLNERVAVRVADNEADDSFAAELRGMATTGMDTEFVEQLLCSVPEQQSWAIGEAFAECVLADDPTLDVCWPWNMVRDRRTPRASLPGADLVGFCRQGETVVLLFGEVKTSSDKSAPPNVMYGRGGMAWQLEEEATKLDIHHALLKWLRVRCMSEEHISFYRKAVQRYLQSQGKEIILVGVLLRDTTANELDVVNRSITLAGKLEAPTQIEITAWYLPIAIEDWPSLLAEDAT
jgi:hypothetical protein